MTIGSGVFEAVTDFHQNWHRRNNPKRNKMLSYRRDTALQGILVLAESGRLQLGDNILLIL